jgi:hypothetical protein
MNSEVMEQLVQYIKNNKSLVINVRCNECYRVVLARHNDKYSVYNHECWEHRDRVEILDSRMLGGTCGLLVTVGREDMHEETELDSAVPKLYN